MGISNIFKKKPKEWILSQKEYKDKFLTDKYYIKREAYEEYITKRLTEEFDMTYNGKAKRWYSKWDNNQRFVVEIFRPKGTHLILCWGYNYNFIPQINNRDKLVWHRTDNAIIIHLNDSWHNHVVHTRKREWGYDSEEYYNPELCQSFQYQIPTYTTNKRFALKYIKNVIDKNIVFMREWLDEVKTIEDAIELIEKRFLTQHSIYVHNTCYVGAFLLAKNKRISEAMEMMQKAYGSYEVPQVLVKALNKTAEME